MDAEQERLNRCFAVVFPDLPERDIPKASTKNAGDWNSVATLTLVSLIEEEFSLRFTPEQIDQFSSYESILREIRSKQRASSESQ